MSLDSKNPCMGEADAFSDSSSKEESRRLMQHIPPNSRPRGNKGSDDMDETRNPMYLSLESDFDSLLFDVNWMDGQSANNNGLQGGNGGGFSADIGDVVKVEARQSLLTAGPHDQHGAAAAAYQATSTGTAAGVGLNSLTPFPNASFVAHELGNGGTNNHASSYAHTMQSAPGATFTVNASDNTTYNNPALQTLAFNAMAASASLAANSGAGPMSNAFFMSGDVQQQQPAMMLPPGLQQQQLSNAASSATATPNLPPFLLFDAPIELRANFIASQRAHGLPPLADNNMLHYQQQQQLSSKTAASTNGSSGPRLIDGRHGDVANNRVKNEREQKRTQKIADLIDQLREKMEHGGWKVGGAKSKYATLSTYVQFE
jgi:hypothetical protein